MVIGTFTADAVYQDIFIQPTLTGSPDTILSVYTLYSVPASSLSVVATVNPASGMHGQSFAVTAAVTHGAGTTVTNVSVDLSAIGGSASASLVLSNANVYTNTFTIQVGTPIGAASLKVSATDTTPLTNSAWVAFTVLPGSLVWDGGSVAGNTWSDSANWLGNVAPLPGDSLTFAGSTPATRTWKQVTA